MKTKLASARTALALTCAVLLATLVPARALAGQQLPAIYYGVVTVAGPGGSIPAPAGSVISAMVGSHNVTPITVSVGMGGRYGGPGGADDKLLVQDAADYTLNAGDSIDFYDNGVKARESSAFQSGSVSQLNLTVDDTQGPSAPVHLKDTSEPNVNRPAFTWDPSADVLSGVASYAVRLDGGQFQWLGGMTSWTADTDIADGAHTIYVEARDGVGNVGGAASLDFNIDTSLPAVMDVSASAQQNSAIITWRSNKPALSWLDYGMTAGSYAKTVDGATSPATDHMVTLTGLVESTTYHYRISIKDSLGNEATSKDLFFTTLAPAGPGSTPLAGGGTPTPATSITTTITVTAPGNAGSTTQVVTTTVPPPAGVPSGVMDASGTMLEDRMLVSADGNARLDISQGVRALDASGRPLAQVAAVPLLTPPAFYTGVLVMAYDFQPEGATFSPPVRMTMSYSPAAMPQGYSEGRLSIAYYDSLKSDWVILPSTVDSQSHTVSALVSRLAPYALLAADERTSMAPVPEHSFIDALLEKAIIAAASLLAFIAALVALVVILRMRRRKAS